MQYLKNPPKRLAADYFYKNKSLMPTYQFA